MNESCESKVANLLARLDGLPKADVEGKFRVLIAALEEQEKEISELRSEFEVHDGASAEDAHGRLQESLQEKARTLHELEATT